MDKIDLGVSFLFLTVKSFKEIFHIPIFSFTVGLCRFCKGQHIEFEMNSC